MKLSNNAVFITGGASGIGFALAKSFLELKNTVIICGPQLEDMLFEYPITGHYRYYGRQKRTGMYAQQCQDKGGHPFVNK